MLVACKTKVTYVSPSHRGEQGTAQDALEWSNIIPLLSPIPKGNRVWRQLPQTHQLGRLGPGASLDLEVWEDHPTHPHRGHHNCMHHESPTFIAIPWHQHTPWSALTHIPIPLPLSPLYYRGFPPPHTGIWQCK